MSLIRAASVGPALGVEGVALVRRQVDRAGVGGGQVLGGHPKVGEQVEQAFWSGPRRARGACAADQRAVIRRHAERAQRQRARQPAVPPPTGAP